MNAKTPEVQIMQPGHYDDTDEEGRMVESPDLGALVALNSSEINQQILTARAYPRSMTVFRKQMREMVTLDADVAQSCLYALKRGNKTIDGPSARFAEVAAQLWGNCRAGARVIDIGEEFVTAQGAFYDLEKNVAVSYEVLRRITDKDGRKFGADMIGVTGNAACAIAIRNAVLKGIPKAFWNDAYLMARKVSVGEGETLANQRINAIKAFQPYGIDPAQIYALLGIKGAEDMTIDHLVLLGGIRNSIRDGETTAEEAFAVENMTNAGQMTPPRPAKSEFERPADKPAAKEPEPQRQQPAAEKPAAEQPKPQQAKEETADERRARMRADFEAWLAEKYSELATLTVVRKVTDLREEVEQQLEGDDLNKWLNACESKQREILNSKKAPPKR